MKATKAKAGKGIPARSVVERLECGKKAIHTITEIVILTYALLHLGLTLGHSILEHAGTVIGK
jgi:hypothetical protein